MADSSRDLGNIDRYGGENFHLWKFQMRAVFYGKDLMGIIDGSEPEPPVTAPTVERIEWKKRDNQAISLICYAVEKNYLKNIMSCTTSKAIWDKLVLLHEQNQSENIQSLQQSFFKCELNESEGIANFLGQLELITSKLAARGDTTFSDKAVIAKVLAKLPSGFDSLLAAWEVTPVAERTLETLTLRLLTQESRMKQRVESESLTTAAYVASATKGKGLNEE